MKKFLSICLVALCSVSAMYAQTTPAPSEAEQNDVKCGSTVTVSATAKSKHFHFDRWEIKGIPTTETIGKGQTSANYTATSRSSKTGTNNELEKEDLTVTIDYNLINQVTGTLTFEAFFTEDPKYSITIKAVDETGNDLDPDDYQIVTNNIPNNYTGEKIDLTVANVQNSCYVFDHWETSTGENKGTNTTLKDATYGSANTTYYAVYKRKTVKIKVTTADNTKGIVAIESVTPPAASIASAILASSGSSFIPGFFTSPVICTIIVSPLYSSVSVFTKSFISNSSYWLFFIMKYVAIPTITASITIPIIIFCFLFKFSIIISFLKLEFFAVLIYIYI